MNKYSGYIEIRFHIDADEEEKIYDKIRDDLEGMEYEITKIDLTEVEPIDYWNEEEAMDRHYGII